MIKVAFIGAGSVVFSRNLTGDILSYPQFRNATFSYMDIDQERLDVGAGLCRKAAQSLGASPTIEATLDRRKALQGADFVINMVQIGSFDNILADFEIPRKYGVNFTIADTTGPGGMFRALRTYPMIKGLCQDMMEVCPDAWLLNYSNPMSMNMQTVYRTSSIQAVGLCHSVQGTFNELMGYIKEKPEDCDFICAGINHMAFFLQMRKNGKDLYPRLWKAMHEDPKVYDADRVRFELMKMLGYFVTESSRHNAEYNASFIPQGPGVIDKYRVPIDKYLYRCGGVDEEFARMKRIAFSDAPVEHHRSHEYGSIILNSIVTGQPAVVYGNMMNQGAISNLPPTAIVETPTLVDRSGCQPTRVGEFPPQLVAYVTPHVHQHELFIRAALEGRRDYVYQAAMADPLTAASTTLDQIKEMCDELIAAHGAMLPPLDGPKSLVPTSGKTFGPLNADELRKSWERAQKADDDTFLQDWKVLGTFKIGTRAKTSLDYQTPFDEAFAKSSDGSVDTNAVYKAADGSSLRWIDARPERRGYVNFEKILGAHDFAIAFAYMEISAVHPRDASLSVGSDDGVRVWLNGKQVHSKEAHRGYTPGEDHMEIHLNAGTNYLLLKIDNYTGGWGCGASLSRPTA